MAAEEEKLEKGKSIPKERMVLKLGVQRMSVSDGLARLLK